MRRTKQETAEYKRRKARAQREANRAEDPLTLPLRIRAARRRAGAKRRAALEAIGAKVEAARKPHNMTLGSFLRLKPEIRRSIRFNAGRQAAPAVRRASAADKANQIRSALTKFLSETGNKALPAKTIATRMRADRKRYFPGDLPYASESNFEREIKVALASLRPRRARKP